MRYDDTGGIVIPMARLKVLTVKVSATLSAKIARLARKRGVTQSEVVREALERLSGLERLTFGEAAAEFIGAARGPGDLTTNPRYMDDYGK
jgi:predicted transcriptional regulator